MIPLLDDLNQWREISKNLAILLSDVNEEEREREIER